MPDNVRAAQFFGGFDIGQLQQKSSFSKTRNRMQNLAVTVRVERRSSVSHHWLQQLIASGLVQRQRVSAAAEPVTK